MSLAYNITVCPEPSAFIVILSSMQKPEWSNCMDTKCNGGGATKEALTVLLFWFQQLITVYNICQQFWISTDAMISFLDESNYRQP